MSELSCGTRFIGRNETLDLSLYLLGADSDACREPLSISLNARFQWLARVAEALRVRLDGSPGTPE